LFAIKLWTFNEITFPIYLIIIQTLYLTVFIFRKK
jgi:hypothetical protein